MPNDQAKTIAIISYITLIGWVIALVMHNNEQNKSELAAFHLRQSLGLMLLWIAGYIVLALIPFFGWALIPIWAILMLILVVLGIISAANEEQKTLPVVGEFFQKTFSGLGR